MHPFVARFGALALLTLLVRLPASAQVLLDDEFADGDVSGMPTAPGFWKHEANATDNGIFEAEGYLTLLATKNAYTFASINSALDERLNFFTKPITVAVASLMLGRYNLGEQEATFRFSLNSTPQRQNQASQSISLRFFPGSAALGFKTETLDRMAAEDMRGTEKGGVCYVNFEGNVTGFSLSLDPRSTPNTIHYTLVLQTDGPLPVITRTGRMNLTRSQWGADGRSALVLETRRNTASIVEYSYVSASIGRVTVTSP